MLDPVPERLEFGAVQHCLPRPHLPALIRVLDLESTGELAQDVADLAELLGKRFRNGQRSVLQRRSQFVLNLALGVDVVLRLEVFPECFRLLNAQR